MSSVGKVRAAWLIAAATLTVVMCGCRHAGTSKAASADVRPLPVSVVVDSLTDGIYPVSFDPAALRRTEGGMVVDFEVFSMDLYDAVELHQLQAGQTIELKGESMTVTSISKDGNIVINGGEELGGADLVSVGGGVYRYCGMDDIATYTSHGKVSLTVSDSLDFEDRGNVSESMEGVLVPAGDVFEYLTKEAPDVFSQYSTYIRIEDGEVVEFGRRYRP